MSVPKDISNSQRRKFLENAIPLTDDSVLSGFTTGSGRRRKRSCAGQASEGGNGMMTFKEATFNARIQIGDSALMLIEACMTFYFFLGH